MAIRSSHVVWDGGFKKGKGQFRLGTGSIKGNFDFKSRFEDGNGTNPEELIAAAHAGCFSMALANVLETSGFPAERIDTVAHVELGKDEIGAKINWIELETEADVPRLDERQFLEFAEQAKRNCPVSRALASTSIRMNARLVGVPVRVGNKV